MTCQEHWAMLGRLEAIETELGRPDTDSLAAERIVKIMEEQTD